MWTQGTQWVGWVLVVITFYLTYLLATLLSLAHHPFPFHGLKTSELCVWKEDGREQMAMGSSWSICRAALSVSLGPM